MIYLLPYNDVRNSVPYTYLNRICFLEFYVPEFLDIKNKKSQLNALFMPCPIFLFEYVIAHIVLC